MASTTISNKIMNLKFMQRHKNQAEQQQRAAVDATKRLEAEWTMEQGATTSVAAPAAQSTTTAVPATAPAAKGRVLTLEDLQANEQQALLRFQPGRRSFGSFNPRLEKRLSEIAVHKREAKETMESERRAAAESSRRAAEHAQLVQRADKEEAVERQNGVSDGEMAARYAKFLPKGFAQTTAPMPEPPVVTDPVRVRDIPLSGSKRKSPSQ